MNVLFRQDFESEWEHIILFDDNGITIDDTLENHHLDAKDVLELLHEHNIINLKCEEIIDEE